MRPHSDEILNDRTAKWGREGPCGLEIPQTRSQAPESKGLQEDAAPRGREQADKMAQGLRARTPAPNLGFTTY